MSAVQRQFSWSNLPAAPTGVAFSFLPMQDLLNATSVSKRFRDAVHTAFERALTEISKAADRDLVKEALLRFRVSFPAAADVELFRNFCRSQLDAARDTRTGYIRAQGIFQAKAPVQALAQMQEIYQASAAERDISFACFCNNIRDYTESDDGEPTVVAIPGATAAAKRAWLNDPANEVALSRYKNLSVIVLASLPSEICRFTGVKTLRITSAEAGAKLLFLPRQMTALRDLSELRIVNSDFKEVPAVLAAFPFLGTVILNNYSGWLPDQPEYVRTPIRELPDDIARRSQAGSFETFCKRAYYLSWGGKSLRELGQKEVYSGHVYHTFPWYMNLPEEELNAIPFFIWFREKFSIPHIPMEDVRDIIVPKLKKWWPGPEVLGMILSDYPLMVFFLLMLLYNCLIIPINLLTNYLVEPLVTLTRDLLGYSRMVHIRDLPPAAPPQL